MWTRLIALSLALIACASCSKGDADTAKLVKELDTTHVHEGKQVELKGYLRAGGHGAFVNGGTLTAGLAGSAWAAEGDVTVKKIQLKFGKEANGIFMPEKYKREEIELRDKTGENVGLGAKVKVTGTVKYKTTGEIDEPKAPSGPIVLDMQRQEYAKAKAAYEERKKRGDLFDYDYSLVDVTIEKL